MNLQPVSSARNLPSVCAGSRPCLLCLILGGLLLCGASGLANGGETWLYMKSGYGDFVGQGLEYSFSDSNTTFSIYGDSTRVGIDVGVYAVYEGFTLTFCVSPAITNGVYAETNGSFLCEYPGLSISGHHRFCSTIDGEFQVREISFDTNGVPVSFWATFAQSCDKSQPMRGEILFNAHRPVLLHAPQEVSVVRGQNLTFLVTATATNALPVALTAANLPVGASFTDHGDGTATFSWTPTWSQIGNAAVSFHGTDTLGGANDLQVSIAVTPQSAVSSLRLESVPFGGDARVFLTADDGTFGANGSFRHDIGISFVETNGSPYNFEFVASGADSLSAGTSSNLTYLVGGVPSSFGQAGLSVSANRINCLPLDGSFKVKQVVYGSTDEPLAFWASFEIQCDGSTGPPLFGEVKFNADVPVALQAPFNNSVIVDRMLSFTVTADDADGHIVELTADGLPDGASFRDNDDNTGTFVWTPDVTQAGDFHVDFRAEDGLGQFDTASARIAVDPAPVSVFGVEKGRVFLQKKTGPPRPVPKGLGFGFSAFVGMPTNGTTGAARIRLASGHELALALQSDGKSFGFTQFFTNEFSLGSVFPDGTYGFTVTSSGGGTLTLSVDLPSGEYPAAPHLNNWFAAQNVNAEQPLVLTWDAFVGGRTNDFVQVQIADASGAQTIFATPDIGEDGALDGTATSTVIPTNTFQPGQVYVGLLTFTRVDVVDRVSYPHAIGYGGRAAITGFLIETMTNPKRGAGSVGFSSRNYIVNDGVGLATISVVRKGGNTLPVTVSYATSDGTGRAGVDYGSVSGAIMFDPGVTSRSFTVPIVSGCASNGPKSITLLLSKPGGKSIGARKSTLSILGD